MTPLWWSILLAVVGVTGLFLAGRRELAWLGWSVGLSAQALWITFALVTGQYGFIASALAYGAVYLLNVYRALTPKDEA